MVSLRQNWLIWAKCSEKNVKVQLKCGSWPHQKADVCYNCQLELILEFDLDFELEFDLDFELEFDLDFELEFELEWELEFGVEVE